jgi:hypothetical protein
LTRLPRRSAAALAVAAFACGCGTPSPDLFVVTRTGTIPGGALSVLVRDDGTARCNGGGERAIGDERLLTARELARDLREPAERALSLAPRPGSIMRYRVRVEDGTVSFSDTSRGQPGVFFRVAAFTREIARDVCGLAR